MPCPGANTPWSTARYTPPPTTATSIAPLVFRKLRRFKVIDCRSLEGEREESPVPIQGVLGLLCNYLGWRSFSAHTHFCRRRGRSDGRIRHINFLMRYIGDFLDCAQLVN